MDKCLSQVNLYLCTDPLIINFTLSHCLAFSIPVVSAAWVSEQETGVFCPPSMPGGERRGCLGGSRVYVFQHMRYNQIAYPNINQLLGLVE